MPSNVEKYLSVIAGHGGEIPSEPASRVEWLLNEIIEEGGIGGKLKPKVVTTLPVVGETGVLYLVPVQDTSGSNTHDEYIWIEEETRYELLGQAKLEIDLSGLVPDTREVGGVPLSDDIPVRLTGDSTITVTNTGTASAIGYRIAHNDSGVTAGSKGDATNQTPGFGDTFRTLSVTVDAKGHVTELEDRTVKVPNATATTQADGLMSKSDKAKLDRYASKGSSVKGVYIDANGAPQNMTYEVNADVPTGFASATAAPPMDGTASVGTSVKYAREDHRHPSDTSRASAADVEAIKTLLQSAVLYRTASGNPATFDDGAAANVRDLKVIITPAQSGSGDPSPTNVRTISGVSSVTVTRTGENGANSQSVTVSLTDGSNPLTVYGGTLNVTTGELTVTYKIFNFNTSTIGNSDIWPGWLNVPGLRDCVPDNVAIDLPGAFCNIAKRMRVNTVNYPTTGSPDMIGLYSVDVGGLTVEQLQAMAIPVQFVAPLISPVTYRLTPAQLATLHGYNAISADAGSVAVEYRADVALSLGGTT